MMREVNVTEITVIKRIGVVIFAWCSLPARDSQECVNGGATSGELAADDGVIQPDVHEQMVFQDCLDELEYHDCDDDVVKFVLLGGFASRCRSMGRVRVRSRRRKRAGAVACVKNTLHGVNRRRSTFRLSDKTYVNIQQGGERVQGTQCIAELALELAYEANISYLHGSASHLAAESLGQVAGDGNCFWRSAAVHLRGKWKLLKRSISRTHPSRDVIFFGQSSAQKIARHFHLSHDVSEPLKQALLASHDVIVSSQIAVR